MGFTGKLLRFTIFQSVLLLTAFQSANAQLQGIQLSPAETLLERDFLASKGGVASFDKPITLYHYFNAATKSPGVLWDTYQRAETRLGLQGQMAFDLASLTGSFWNLADHDTKLVNAGPGMYLAIDPLVSQTFGHSTYILTFGPGTKYIDVSDPTWKNVSKIKLSKETMVALQQEQIVTSSNISELGMRGSYFTRITMQYIAGPGNEKLRDAVSKIFERNNIVLVQFSWELTKLKMFCKNPSSSAFSYIGAKPLNTQASVVRSIISPDVVRDAVFMSRYDVANYTPEETKKVELTKNFKAALASGSKAVLSPDEVQAIKEETFSCQ